MQIHNFFHCKANNVGDRMCGPGQYLWPELNQDFPLGFPAESVTRAIVGGGQIFSELRASVEHILEFNPKAKVIAWGVGLPPAGRRDQLVREITQSFAAIGTRNYDYKDQFTFVPCASCLSPLFDQVIPPRHEIVAYLHRRKGEPVEISANVPTMTNALRPPKEVIDFIASGEIVVTSSYHGVYWAQLLGRRVICIPYNNKFETFQHRPTMAEFDDWEGKLSLASRAPPMLEEYRKLNYAFAKHAMEIWNG